MKRFLLSILVIFLAVIVLTMLEILGYVSATRDISSFVKIIVGTIALCIADIKGYLQWKVINWNKGNCKGE